MSFTPRRSTRGQIFTPVSTPSTPLLSQPNVSYKWLSSSSIPEGSTHPHYRCFSRITTQAARKDQSKGKGKAKGPEESRFTVGDGVSVSVDGGSEGVGILLRLWEEPPDEHDRDEEEEDEDEVDEEEREEGPKMMAEVHWCLRRQDLPGVMKNLEVQDNEVLLAASPVRPVSTHLPIQLLHRTLPIYSRQFFKAQYEHKMKSEWKGWSIPMPGVYWCNRAFDKGAKGGKVWKVDIDAWREGGKAGEGWSVPSEAQVVAALEAESEGSGSEDEGSAHEDEDEEDEDEEVAEEGKATPRKRKRAEGKVKTPRKAKAMPSKAARPTPKGKKPRKLPHPKSNTSYIPIATFDPLNLPTDPYERALRLLHVGATPESLPCREEEFVDVLSRVEEGVESGGGGCLYIAGVPGTGKTATVHAVVKELKRKAEDGELMPFSYVEINGLKIPSPQHAYTVLWEAISGAKNCSTKTALRGLESHFNRKTTGVRGPRANTLYVFFKGNAEGSVVLMDELDQLLTAKQDVVYNFFNWPTMRGSQLFVIAVANRMDLPQHLAAKIKSRLGLQTLLFQPYDRDNLIEIVQSRLIEHPKSSEDHKVLQRDAVMLAATKMAGTNGDARRVLDACRRAVEVAIEKTSLQTRHPVTAKEMMAVLQQMSSSPVAMFVRQCSTQQKVMMAAMVRCVRREGVPEISWRSVRTDHDALTRNLLESNNLLSTSELALVLTSLLASHALTVAWDLHKSLEDRKVALGMEIGEVGRVLMNEGEGWRRALAGV